MLGEIVFLKLKPSLNGKCEFLSETTGTNVAPLCKNGNTNSQKKLKSSFVIKVAHIYSDIILLITDCLLLPLCYFQTIVVAYQGVIMCLFTLVRSEQQDADSFNAVCAMQMTAE